MSSRDPTVFLSASSNLTAAEVSCSASFKLSTGLIMSLDRNSELPTSSFCMGSFAITSAASADLCWAVLIRLAALLVGVMFILYPLYVEFASMQYYIDMSNMQRLMCDFRGKA